MTQKVVNKLSSRISGKNEDAGFSIEKTKVPLKIEHVSSLNLTHVTTAFEAAINREKLEVDVTLFKEILFLKQKKLKPL